MQELAKGKNEPIKVNLKKKKTHKNSHLISCNVKAQSSVNLVAKNMEPSHPDIKLIYIHLKIFSGHHPATPYQTFLGLPQAH